MSALQGATGNHPEYVNSLHLKDANGNALLLDENGNGTFKDYVLKTVLESAQKVLDSGMDLGLEDKVTEWLTIENRKAVAIDFDKFVKYRTRVKPTPPFDSVALDSWENELFGTEEIFSRHFSQFSYGHSRARGMLAEAKQIKMMNPMYYIDEEQAVKAKHFRIRHGSVDRDTSLAISNLFVLKLMSAGIDAELAYPGEVSHAGDYDLDELFAWIDEICSVE